jgi:probable HAF family extracellular repeat protein
MLVSVLVCSVLGAVSAVANPYYLTDLAPVSGDTVTAADAINSVGGSPMACGRSQLAAGQTTDCTPVRWNSQGVPTNLLPLIPGALPGQGNRGNAIDTSGDVAGNTLNASGTTVGFYVPAGSTGQILPTLGGSGGSQAMGVNSLGMVVGDSPAPDGTVHAYVWSTATGIVDLGNGSAFGAAGAYATAITANGNTIAGYTISSGGGYMQACEWTKSGSNWAMATICPQSIYDQSQGLAINNNGYVVGGCFNYPSTGFPSTDQYAIEIKPDGTVVTLGDLGLASAHAQGINDSGVVVGYDWYKAFVNYTGLPGGNIDLGTLISPVSGAGWNFSTSAYAYGIDDNGEIAGYAKNPAGDYQGYILKPAIPGDANLDGKVDINDLTVVLTNYGKTAMAWSQGCMDGDPTGTVDINDLTIVLTNYGKTAALSFAAVPEPSAIAILLAGAIGLLAYAWRRRK